MQVLTFKVVVIRLEENKPIYYRCKVGIGSPKDRQ